MFTDSDLSYLAGIPGRDNRPLFEPVFIDYLCGFRFSCDVDAMPEGTIAFPQEPLLRVQGPILHSAPKWPSNHFAFKWCRGGDGLVPKALPN